jgi:hypothetical protein
MFSNVITGQYSSDDYTLKRFFMNEIPNEIRKVIRNLIDEADCILRGGMAYVCITEDMGYQLKDIDLLGKSEKKELMLMLLGEADVVYLNKNSFAQDVISAFWREEDGYYKIDILLVEGLPEYSFCEYDGFLYKTVSAEYIWKNRIEKIVQRNIRKHSIDKTINHYRVAKNVSIYLLEKDFYKCDEQMLNEVSDMLFEVKSILHEIMDEKTIESFISIQETLIEKIRGLL